MFGSRRQLLTQASMASTAIHPWKPGPLQPRLAEGAVHVWRADLSAVSNDVVELLSIEERARAERLLSPRRRRLWTRAHGVLRALLGRYMDTDPRALGFTAGAHGKPALLDDEMGSIAMVESASERPARPSFNLSHSGRLALFAFAGTGDVGVDIQVPRRPIDEVAIAARAFGPAEARRLEVLDPAIREREFLRSWTRHEAELKCRGSGIGAHSTDASGFKPWIAELEVGARLAAAVAVERPPDEMRRWDWRAWTAG
jgi:4'-phosphopantetheinyl transferase